MHNDFESIQKNYFPNLTLSQVKSQTVHILDAVDKHTETIKNILTGGEVDEKWLILTYNRMLIM